MNKPTQLCHASVIEAMVTFVLENEEKINAHSSGQIIFDYSRIQVACRIIPKPTVKRILPQQNERIKL